MLCQQIIVAHQRHDDAVFICAMGPDVKNDLHMSTALGVSSLSQYTVFSGQLNSIRACQLNDDQNHRKIIAFQAPKGQYMVYRRGTNCIDCFVANYVGDLDSFHTE